MDITVNIVTGEIKLREDIQYLSQLLESEFIFPQNIREGITNHIPDEVFTFWNFPALVITAYNLFEQQVKGNPDSKINLEVEHGRVNRLLERVYQLRKDPKYAYLSPASAQLSE